MLYLLGAAIPSFALPLLLMRQKAAKDCVMYSSSASLVSFSSFGCVMNFLFLTTHERREC